MGGLPFYVQKWRNGSGDRGEVEERTGKREWRENYSNHDDDK